MYPELKAIVGATVPNYQGMFLRGHGSQKHAKNNGVTVGVTTTTHVSGNLAQIQGDAVRSIWGYIDYLHTDTSPPDQRDPRATMSRWYKLRGFKYLGGGGQTDGICGGGIYLNSNDVTPTADEIRPVNVAVKYIIFAKE